MAVRRILGKRRSRTGARARTARNGDDGEDDRSAQHHEIRRNKRPQTFSITQERRHGDIVAALRRASCTERPRLETSQPAPRAPSRRGGSATSTRCRCTPRPAAPCRTTRCASPGRDAAGDEIVAHVLGAARAEGEVVLAGAALVGMALDEEAVVRIALRATAPACRGSRRRSDSGRSDRSRRTPGRRH